MARSQYVIALHGGAGNWDTADAPRVLSGLRQALRAGLDVLQQGGSALDAVVTAVALLEDDPVFNAGTGSVLNLEGEAEMDAAVMAGDTLSCGGVACIRRVKNPVLIARKVMEETGHVLLAGEGALRFARALGYADYDPVTPERRRSWDERRTAALADPQSPCSHLTPLLASGGTVGAAALDAEGRLAAATSTGGITLKLPGRVGDTAIPGAGNYANRHAAVSATGHGELMLRVLTAKAVCDRVATGQSAQQATDAVLADMRETVGDAVGIIAVDSRGRVGIVHGTSFMPHAYAGSDVSAIVAAMGTNIP
jgi:L-asparaginase / beta-aspartyl-peptidase